MTTALKITLAIGVPAVIFTGYWYGFRNRRPNLVMESINWHDKTGIVRFGNTVNNFDTNGGKSFSAGKTYNEHLYNCTITGSPDQVKIEVFKDGKLVDKKVIDFVSQKIVTTKVNA